MGRNISSPSPNAWNRGVDWRDVLGTAKKKTGVDFLPPHLLVLRYPPSELPLAIIIHKLHWVDGRMEVGQQVGYFRYFSLKSIEEVADQQPTRIAN